MMRSTKALNPELEAQNVKLVKAKIEAERIRRSERQSWSDGVLGLLALTNFVSSPQIVEIPTSLVDSSAPTSKSKAKTISKLMKVYSRRKNKGNFNGVTLRKSIKLKPSAINNPKEHPSSPNVGPDEQEQSHAIPKKDSSSMEHRYAQVQETQQVEEKPNYGVQYCDLSFLDASSLIEAETLPLNDASAVKEKVKKDLQRILGLDFKVLSELQKSYLLRLLSFLKDNGQLSESSSMLFSKVDTLFANLDISRKSQQYNNSKFASAIQKKSEIYTERGKIQDLTDELQQININKSSLSSEIRDLELELGELKQQEVVLKTQKNNLSTYVGVMSKSLYACLDKIT